MVQDLLKAKLRNSPLRELFRELTACTVIFYLYLCFFIYLIYLWSPSRAKRGKRWTTPVLVCTGPVLTLYSHFTHCMHSHAFADSFVPLRTRLKAVIMPISVHNIQRHSNFMYRTSNIGLSLERRAVQGISRTIVTGWINLGEVDLG